MKRSKIFCIKNSIIFSCLAVSSIVAMDDLCEQLSDIAVDATKEKNRESSIRTAQMCLDMLKEGIIKPERTPGIDQLKPHGMPAGHIIEKFDKERYKGKFAFIKQSLWTLYGIDTLNSTQHLNYIFGAGIPVIKFYFDCPTYALEGFSPLYYGKIGDTGCIIPQNWLSQKDVKNLYKFHRNELKAHGKQLFDSQAPARKILLAKIENELNLEKTFFMAKFLEDNQEALAKDPQCIKKVKELEDLATTLFDNQYVHDPEYRVKKSVFLHAALMEAIIHTDLEIMLNRNIIYNSWAILKEHTLDEVLKDPTEENLEVMRKNVKALVVLAEFMRPQSIAQKTGKLYWTDLLHHDVRTMIFKKFIKIHEILKITRNKDQK